MNENVARFPQLKLFSLPSFLPDGGRRIELGVRGDPAHVDAGDRASARGRRGRGIPLGTARGLRIAAMPTAQDAAPRGTRSATLRAPLRALVQAIPVLFAPRILAVVLLPLVAAAGIWTVVGWIAWSPLTQWLRATLYGAHGGWSEFAAGASAALLLMLAAVLTALVAVAVLAMPVIVETVAERDYPSLAKLRGGTFTGGLVNAIATIRRVPAALAAGALPACRCRRSTSRSRSLQSAWLNQRLFRYDALALHARPRRVARRDRDGARAPVRAGTRCWRRCRSSLS